MSYKRINWKDHVVEFPLRRKITDNGDGTYNVKPDVGEIIQKGTKQSALNFNHMDEGILDAHLAVQLILQSGLGNSSFERDEAGNIIIPGYITEETLNRILTGTVYKMSKSDVEHIFDVALPDIEDKPSDKECGCDHNLMDPDEINDWF